MSSLSSHLASFTPSGDPEEASEKLASHLAEQGFQTHVPKSFRAFGVTSVHVKKDDALWHVLVYTGDDPTELRQKVARFLELPSLDTEPRLVSACPLPPDVAFLFSDDLLAAFERRLARESFPDMRTTADLVPTLVDTYRPRLEAAAGVTLTGDLEAVTSAVDTVVLRLRSVGDDDVMPEDAVTPMRTLVLLGLIATEAFREALGYGALQGMGTLGDVGGFPAVWTGNSQIAIAQKVLKLYRNGPEDSVRFLATTALTQQQTSPPDEPATGGQAEPEDDTERERRLQERARYAPAAGLLLVGLADDELEHAEITAFTTAAEAAEHPAVTSLLSVQDFLEQLRTLRGDPRLPGRALAAAGVLFEREDDPESAREAFFALLRPIAETQGTIRPVEQEALDTAAALLNGGLAKACEPGIDHDLDRYRRQLERCALTPWYAFLMVVKLADDDVQKPELQAFMGALEACENDLLRQIMARAGGGTFDEGNFAAAMTDLPNPEKVKGALGELGRLFHEHPGGQAARGAFVAMLERVVVARGQERAELRDTLDHVMGIVDGGARRNGCLFPSILLLSGMVAMWQVLSAALGLLAWFVPVAILIQLGVLTLALMGFRGENGIVRFMLGTFVSVASAVLIALSSLVVGGLLFPALAASQGGVLWGAVSGALGTVFTGVVWSGLVSFALRFIGR